MNYSESFHCDSSVGKTSIQHNQQTLIDRRVDNRALGAYEERVSMTGCIVIVRAGRRKGVMVMIGYRDSGK